MLLFFMAANIHFQEPEAIFASSRLGMTKDISIEIVDSVTGNCFIAPDRIRNSVRLIFEQSQIPVLEGENLFPTVTSPRLLLYANGYATNSVGGTRTGCTGYLIAQLGFYAFPGFQIGDETYRYEAWSVPFQSEVIATSSGTLDSQFQTHAEDMARELAADILAGRRSPAVQEFLRALDDEQ